MKHEDIKGFLHGSKDDDTHTPVEEDNTLMSRAVARFVDLICEGEVEGLVNGEESVSFGHIPIRAAGGAYNFRGASIRYKPGSPDGVPLREYPTSESIISVDLKMTIENGPVIQIITDPDIDALVLTFTIPALFRVNDDGDTKKTTVKWKVEIKPDGGDWVLVKNMEKYGKCVAAYQTSMRINNLTDRYGAGPWQVRCTRITADSGSNSKQNSIYWSSYTQIINRRMIYPDSSVIGVTLNSQLFGTRVPSRQYHIKGARILIPTNYDPVQRTYGLTWDGTFKRAYCNNPAWVFYDLVTNDRYGLGLEPEFVDKWGLMTIAQYCDVLVPDGMGGTEPRYTYNGVLQKRVNGIAAIAMVCSNFRALPYWAGGQLRVAQDSPKDSSKLITAANVVDGLFQYAYSSMDTRFTVANVSWNDPDNFFKLTVESVDDRDGIDRYGYQPTDVVAVGCTSRGQAYRYGRWILYTALNETETVTFRASWDNADVVPGEIISVMDNHEAATRAGGRLVSATSNTVTLDGDGVLLESVDAQGNPITYSMTFVDPEGTLVERTVTTVPDDLYHKTLDLSSSWPGDEPQVDSIWILSASNLVPKEYRVITNTEVEPNIFEIVAGEYDSNKYAEVEDGKLFDPAPITKVPDANTQLEPPTNIQIEQYTYDDTGGASDISDRKTAVLMSWTHTTDVRFQTYVVQWKSSSGSWADNEVIKTTDNYYDFRPMTADTYSFRVRATGLTRESTWLTISEYSITDTPDAPPQVTGLTSIEEDVGIGTTFNGKDCEIGWDPMTLAIDSTSYTPYDDATSVPTHAVEYDSNVTKIKDFQIEVMDPNDGDKHLRYEFVTDNKFKYLYAMNVLDNGTPIREIKFKVWARDIFLQLSNDPAIITVENPAPTMAGTTPTVDDIFTGLKIDWSAITVADNDMSKYRVYLDESNPPTTQVAEVSSNANVWVEAGLSADTLYRVQIEPYDEFGVGTKSNVASGTPLKIPTDDIDVELTSRLTITDSYDQTSADFSWVYDHVYDVVGQTYNAGDWINIEFPTEQLVDRVSVWMNKTADLYFRTIDEDNVLKYFGGDGSGDLVDGRLTEYASLALAQANPWNADAGADTNNTALFPNGLAMSNTRMYFDTNSTGVNEFLVVDQVIAEWVVASQLSAIAADMGVLTAGIIQSPTPTANTGIIFDMDDEDVKFGGTDPNQCKLHWDDAASTLKIRGVIDVEAGSDVPWDEVSGANKPEDNATDNTHWEAAEDQTKIDGGELYVGSLIHLSEGGVASFGDQNVIIDTAGSHGSLVVAEDGGPTTGSYCELSDGNIKFQYWDENQSQHHEYSSITRIETGVGANDEWVYIPGIFKEAPRVMVSPNAIQSYNINYKTQSQKMKFEVISLQQYEPLHWRFKPRATLDLSAGSTGGVDWNLIYSSTAGTYNTDWIELPPNTKRINVDWQTNQIYAREDSRVSCTGRKKDGNYTCRPYTSIRVSRYYTGIQGYRSGVGAVDLTSNTWAPSSRSGQTYPNWVNDSGNLSFTITHFRIFMRNYSNRKKRSIYSGGLTKGYNGYVHVNTYSSNQTATSVVEPGTLNWMAVGV